MSASLITGLPRHGKSLFGVMQVKTELVGGKRYVVTNLPFDVVKLGAYLEEVCGCTVEPGMFDRLRILTPDETAEFYLYDPEGEIDKAVPLVSVRARPWRLKPLKQTEALLVPDFSHRQRDEYPGVLFLIDEAHLFFDAHHWQQLGHELSFFISQHGHMRTDVMFITQHPAKLAKRLKLDLEEWTVVQNLGRVKLWGGVTLPGWFQRATFPGKPDDAEQGDPEIGRFRMDKRLADCYSTSAGVGLSGRVDTQEQKRGAHWSKWVWRLALGGAAAVILPFLALKAMGSLVHKGLGSYFESATAVAGKAASPPGMGVVSNGVSAAARPGPGAVPAAVSPRPALPDVVGVSSWGVCLDDGRTLTPSEGYRWATLPDGVYVAGLGHLKWKEGARKPPVTRLEPEVQIVRGAL